MRKKWAMSLIFSYVARLAIGCKAAFLFLYRFLAFVVFNEASKKLYIELFS